MTFLEGDPVNGYSPPEIKYIYECLKCGKTGKLYCYEGEIYCETCFENELLKMLTIEEFENVNFEDYEI
jgi:DNA-directed RNA polymerase subunit RPC12/RpoP